MWCGLWKREIRRIIPFILVQRAYGGMEERLYVGKKSNKKKCVKVMELGVFFFLFFVFISLLE
jgi:hypothetical protein